jgi:hypothetical protein
MIRKKRRCPKCGEEVEKKFSYCPYCGFNFERLDNEKTYGLLGKNDLDDSFDNLNPFTKGMPFSNILGSLMQEFEKQFKEMDREIGKKIKKTEFSKKSFGPKSTGFSINISNSSGKQPEIRIRSFGDPNFKKLLEGNISQKELEEDYEKEKKLPQTKISETKLKKLASLPKQEAETQIRRLGNKIIYEINLPGVKSMKEVFLSKLENSVEIKAFSKDKGYFKLIPSNLPIKKYNLRNEKLVIEFLDQ